ncbi:hypothetical protein GBAR_LOCUS15266 [Geodia barretti]|uniref:Uncharacterized protein n=1 Tax=Geodia barretti TaxID=519541 RepID=A0AA35SDI4_GEOBA|nr:hypothetical protein GBAR_LOCUS15266 [Geodia barretti]
MGCGDQSSSDSRSGGDSAVGRKRPLKKLPVKNDSLASFIHRSLYSCSSLFPKTYFKAPTSAEFEGLYWEEQKAHKQQRKADTKKLRALLSDDSVAEMEEHDLDTYHPVGQDDVSDEEEEGGEGLHLLLLTRNSSTLLLSSGGR